ncbi:MAG: tyrosine-protein kinase family protein, partial [Flavitalea sp.]
KMQELLNYLDTIFDYIIIDTAPVSPVTDAYILSPMCDATLYVVRHGYTPKSYVQMLEHNNKVKGLKNLAIVFNGVKSRGIGRYDYGYGYGQSYGYGYGYEEGKSNGKKKKKSVLSFAKKD